MTSCELFKNSYFTKLCDNSDCNWATWSDIDPDGQAEINRDCQNFWFNYLWDYSLNDEEIREMGYCFAELRRVSIHDVLLEDMQWPNSRIEILMRNNASRFGPQHLYSIDDDETQLRVGW